MIRTVVKSDRTRTAFCDVAAKFLDTADRERCVAALAGLANLCPEHFLRSEGRTWERTALQACEAFARLGIEDTWLRFAAHVRPQGKGHREFIRLMIEAPASPDVRIKLVREAAEIWSDDLQLLGGRVGIEIQLGNRDEALARLTGLHERFDERIDQTWIGGQFGKLGLPHDALRHCRLAAERGPARGVAHFHAGWFAFLTGDLRASVESTRRSLELEPTRAMAEFNLGLALLALGETAPAETAYERGRALAVRQPRADARRDLEGAIADFVHLTQLSDASAAVMERVRASLQSELDRSGEAAAI